MIIRRKIIWFPLLIIVSAIIMSATNYSVTVISVGDSTMANYNTSTDLRRGWMQNIGQFFSDEVKIINLAASGRSSKSFIDEGKWASVIRNVDAGDYVIIQFGHNDAKDDTARHTEPWTTYTENLRKFITETRQKGGYPILCTPIVRRSFNIDGTIASTHGEYPAAVRKLATDSSVVLVDLEVLTGELVESYGPDSSKTLFNYVEPGESNLYPNGNADDTHLNDKGASAVEHLFVEELKAKQHQLANFLFTAVEEHHDTMMPENIQLYQNYPNPFNPETIIKYNVLQRSHVILKVCDIRGREIATLINTDQASGLHHVTFKAGELPSGIYFYTIQMNDFTDVKQMLLLK